MTIPAWFLSGLKNLDPQLVVYFNPFRERWVIDRKTEAGETTNVMIVQTEDGEFMPLSENTLDRLRSMDTWKQHGSYEAFHRHNIQVEVEAAKKREEKVKETYRECSKDNRRQLATIRTLLQRHNI